MPSLRGHLVFLARLREPLGWELPEAAHDVVEHWATALLGSEAPDSWFFTDQTRPDTHALDKNDPATWPAATERWLARRPALSPGKAQPPETIAFVIGYLSHIGLDTWEAYQHEQFPAEARAAAPAGWFSAAAADRARRQAVLRALGEAPFPPDLLVGVEELERAPLPPGFPANAIRRVAAGIVPALPLSDPWAISRISPLRERLDTPKERRKWETQRAAVPPATAEEYDDALRSAIRFTLDAMRAWW
ncbi:MAG: hypothetical protein HY332_09450 [Chloroflexi bacterium]|nr:hypothetical protein [Chloroflexota bacterium]